MELLLERGARTRILNNKGQSVRSLAAKTGSYRLSSVLEELPTDGFLGETAAAYLAREALTAGKGINVGLVLLVVVLLLLIVLLLIVLLALLVHVRFGEAVRVV